MKKTLGNIVLFALGAWLAASCTIEHIDNGDLDGFWHFEEMDTLSTGGVLDLTEQTLFWAFQARLMHTQGAAAEYYFRFSHEGNVLVVYEPYADHGHQDKADGGDIPVEDASVLGVYGIQSLADTFHVDRLTGSEMVLSTAAHRLRFTKF